MKRLRYILFILISLVLIVLTVDALVDLEFLDGLHQSFGSFAEVDIDKLPKISNPLLPIK